MDSDGTVAVLWVPSQMIKYVHPGHDIQMFKPRVINRHVISPHPSFPPQIQKRLLDIEDVQKEAKKEEYKDFVPPEDIRYMKEGNQYVANEEIYVMDVKVTQVEELLNKNGNYYTMVKIRDTKSQAALLFNHKNLDLQKSQT